MEYRLLGRSGVSVSALCLGCMNFGERTDEAESIRIINTAMDAGINFIDTANSYGVGESERIVGKALAESGRRDDVVLATKVSSRMGGEPNQWGSSRYHITRQVEQSLRRLRTDRIDLYQIHVMDLTTDLGDILRTLDNLIRAGKVLHIGCSKWAPALLAEAVMLSDRNGWARFVSEQPPYNLLDRQIENELIWTCMRHGLGIIPWGPIAGGILSGKYAADAPAPPGSRFDGPNHRLTPEALKRIEQLMPLAAEKGLSLAEFSLAWVLGQSGITSPIIGPASLEHLQSSLKTIGVTFSDEEKKQINKICPPGGAVSNYYDVNVYRRLRWEVGIIEERPWRHPLRRRSQHHGKKENIRWASGKPRP